MASNKPQTKGETMSKGETVKTIEIQTPHGKATVARVTYAGEFYGKKNYYSHVYNSMAQRISGGFMFVEGTEYAAKFGL